jgi:hypothetical protein
MKIALYIVLFFTTFFASCKEQIKTNNNEFVDVIDADTYALILAEAQLIDAHTTLVRINQPYYKDSLSNYYAGLFEKYNVTSDAFYYSMKAYAYRPDELNEIYNKVLIHLEEIENGLVDELIITKPIVNISRQQVGNIIMDTPFLYSILNDSTGRLEIIQDSLVNFIEANDSIVKLSNTNVASFQYSFILYSHQAPMYANLKSYIKGELEKENGID